MNNRNPRDILAETFPSSYDISSMLKKKNNQFSKRLLVYQLYGEKFNDSDGDTIKSFLAKRNRKSSHRSDVDRSRGRKDRSEKKIEFMTDSTTMSDNFKKRNITSTIDSDRENGSPHFQHVNSYDLINLNHDERNEKRKKIILKVNSRNSKSDISRTKISGFSIGKELRNPTWIQSPEKIVSRKNNNELDAFLDNFEWEGNNDVANRLNSPTNQVDR